MCPAGTRLGHPVASFSGFEAFTVAHSQAGNAHGATRLQLPAPVLEYHGSSSSSRLLGINGVLPITIAGSTILYSTGSKLSEYSGIDTTGQAKYSVGAATLHVAYHPGTRALFQFKHSTAGHHRGSGGTLCMIILMTKVLCSKTKTILLRFLYP